MMLSATGYAAAAPANTLQPWIFQRRELTDHDIALSVDFVGVCHSDLDALRPNAPIGAGVFPLVAGHEFVGHVSAVGSAVTDLSVGDVVAVGNIVDSCRKCGPCLAGKEHFCDNYPTLTYGGLDRYGDRTQGAYSDTYVVDRHFAYAVPDGLDLAGVAPLMCAGITTYSPLRRWHVGPGSVVGIAGVGGLGHIAAKLAVAMGAEVIGFAVNEQKAEAAAALGLHDVVLVTDEQAMSAQFRRFDFILDTVPVPHDINAYLRALVIEGTLCSVGIVERLDFDPVNLIIGGKSLVGAGSGGVPETAELLDFCGRHKITAEVEVLPIDQVNEALDRLARGAVDYRLVLETGDTWRNR